MGVLQQDSWNVLQFTGSTDAKRRHANIRDFQSFAKEAKVFVITLSAGSCGVTLTVGARAAASH